MKDTQIYRVQFPGAGDLDFTVGECHRKYGEVLEIKETMDVTHYDGESYPSAYKCVVKVIFTDQQIVFQSDNPLMAVYWKETEK